MYQQFQPGDFVNLLFSSCGLLFGTDRYSWIPVPKCGLVVSGKPQVIPPLLRYEDEVYILVLVDDSLMWVEIENLQKRF